MEWVEQRPKVGDTVKVEWSDWYAKQIGRDSSIGVLLRFHNSKAIIDFGDRRAYLDTMSTFFVLCK